MPKIADRVKEVSTSTGTGTINLGGAATGYRAFSSAFVTTDVVYYCIEDGTNWEVGYGTLTTGTPWTLSRNLLASSTGSLISFAAGSKNVFCTAPASALATLTGIETLTNKRITPRVDTSETSSATPTINTDNYDIKTLTAQSGDITSFTTNLSGTPTAGQVLIIQITGTAARAITWGASFEASTVALPTTTVSTAMLTVGFIWNTATSKWRCMASA